MNYFWALLAGINLCTFSLAGAEALRSGSTSLLFTCVGAGGLMALCIVAAVTA